MPDRRWKREERAVAEAVGGKRVGPTGKNTSDVLSDRYGVEVKSRGSLPAWLTDALAQAKRNCPPDLDALTADIRSNGLREPITLHPDGAILDGRNRYNACLEVWPESPRWSWGWSGEAEVVN